MLHLALGPSESVLLLEDHPALCKEWMDLHEAAQLALVRQMLAAGVKAMISMDNLDASFHPPRYLDLCSASFYEKASRLCHEAGAVFFIHACGRQRVLLPLIAGLGVDGLEGVAYPTLGDVELDEAMRLSGGRLIITGGISALETERMTSRDEVRRYVENLFVRLHPYRHRFMLSASCNTSIRTRWPVIQWFRDAWLEFGR
jgi:uroporphyrinogen-III decarboxylase